MPSASIYSLVSARFNHVVHNRLVNSYEFGMVVLPILSYWIVAFAYDLLDLLPSSFLMGLVGFCRVKRKERGKENPISKWHVIQRVLLQHAIQFALAFGVMLVDPDQCEAKPPRSWPMTVLEFVLGMLIMDTWQFWIHRWMHVNTYLYKHVHSTHHSLLIPYAYGALYNHPVEALLLDTVGGVVTLYASNMSCAVGAWFMNFATIKTVLDHCGYTSPLNPLHDLFPNSSSYHDVHHDIKHIKKNFSQPFFTHWDWIMGSYMSPTESGFHVQELETSDASSERGGAGKKELKKNK
jgi:sphinganine C4-monooxygenase